MSHHRKNSVRDKVIGKVIYLERNTLHRLNVGHLRRWECPHGKGLSALIRVSNFIGLLLTSVGSSKKQENYRKKIYYCFIDDTKAFDCADHNKLWEILQEMEIPGHLFCFLRNLYAGQEATVRPRLGTKDVFQIRKGLCQAVYCHPACLTYMQSTSCEMLGWMKHNLESRLLGKISKPQICRWHHCYGIKQIRTKKPLDDSERGE